MSRLLRTASLFRRSASSLARGGRCRLYRDVRGCGSHPLSLSLHHRGLLGQRLFCSKPAEEKVVDVDAEDSKAAPDLDAGLDFDTDLDGTKREVKEAPKATEKLSTSSKSESLGFQAETRRILDIVANSLYTDKEVFVRELVSNASDALEKARYLRNNGDVKLEDVETDFEMHILCDKETNKLVIQDFGVGMTREDLIENLGTIARSGSKEFIKTLDNVGSAEAADNIIGQFGVGFYSVFMVADKVEVYTKYADPEKGEGKAHYWTSTGDGNYEIMEAEGVHRGTKIIIHLKEDEKDFADSHKLEDIIDRYSNFVGFPIYLNGKRRNTIGAIWTRSKQDVTEEEHEKFYRYISGSFDAPRYTLHFTADVPLQINSIFYVGETHFEKYGMGRMEPGVSLYSRKVLITPKSKKLLPDWLRFIKGVVDSEDIPLNISRENMQDSALIAKINNVLTKKLISFFSDEAKKDPVKYLEFYKEFDMFLKEGVCTDFVNREKIARLLRFESSNDEVEDGKPKPQSLDDYVSRMKVGQKAIYYLNAPNREMALASPYMETFKKNGTEVLFLYQPMDVIVMKNLMNFNNRKLLSIESSEASQEHDDVKERPDSPIAGDLIQFFSNALASRVTEVKVTDRLTDTPAVIVDHDSRYNRMISLLEQKEMPFQKQKLQINPHHPMMERLHSIKGKQPEIAQLVADQIFDNAMIAADMLDNPRSMLPRLNNLLTQCMTEAGAEPVAETDGEIGTQEAEKTEEKPKVEEKA